MAVQSVPISLYGYGFFIIAAIAMMGASLGTTYWKIVKYEMEPVNHFGLFKVCDYRSQICASYPEVPEYVEVVRAMCLTAISLHGITLLIIGHLLTVRGLEVKSKAHGWLTMWIAFMSAAFASAGPAHFLNKTGLSNWFADITWDFGYSMYFSFVSAFLSIWAGIFAILAVSSMYNAQRLPTVQQFQYATPPMNVVAPVAYVHPSMQQYPLQNQMYPNQAIVPAQAFQANTPASIEQKPKN